MYLGYFTEERSVLPIGAKIYINEHKLETTNNLKYFIMLSQCYPSLIQLHKRLHILKFTNVLVEHPSIYQRK